MAESTSARHSTVQVILAVLAVLAIIALLAWARGEPGIDGRAPDPEDAAAVVQLSNQVG